MSIRRERQRWLGALALAVAVPLPFTGVVGWPFLIPFVGAAIAVLTARKPLKPVPIWAENALAPVILGLVWMAGGLGYGVLRPVAQLAVLVAAVRLLGAVERRRAAMALGLISLVGVAAVASSTHPLLAVYLLALLGLVAAAVARLSTVALAEESGAARLPGWPPARLIVSTVVISALLGTPLFFMFPRLRSPFAAVPFGARPVSGFRESIALEGIGDIKVSRMRALEVGFPGSEGAEPDWLRLAGATVQHYRGGLWAQGKARSERLIAGATRTVELGEVAPSARLQRAEMSLERNGEVLFVPPGAVRLELPEGVPVWRDRLGTLRIPRVADLPVRYAVEFDPSRVNQPEPMFEDLNVGGDRGAVGELARQIVGEAEGDLTRALSIEEYLQRHYAYTTRLGTGPLQQDPVSWFLFKGRHGHCEFFASSMVMLLRSLGIPARLQAGYAGGDRDADGRYVVRESNAHAWVVAYLERDDPDARGGVRRIGYWRVFDPTPVDGRPPVTTPGPGGRLRLGWQAIEGAWDRWVLTFSLADQVEIVVRAWRAVRGQVGTAAQVAAVLLALAAGLLVLRRAARRVAVAEWWGSGGDEPGRAVRRVMALAVREGLLEDRAFTPRDAARRLSHRVPEVGPEIVWLVRAHELASYAGGSPPPRREVRSAMRSVVRALRRSSGTGPTSSAARPALHARSGSAASTSTT